MSNVTLAVVDCVSEACSTDDRESLFQYVQEVIKVVQEVGADVIFISPRDVARDSLATLDTELKPNTFFFAAEDFFMFEIEDLNGKNISQYFKDKKPTDLVIIGDSDWSIDKFKAALVSFRLAQSESDGDPVLEDPAITSMAVLNDSRMNVDLDKLNGILKPQGMSEEVICGGHYEFVH